jgi:hypothetical protein
MSRVALSGAKNRRKRETQAAFYKPPAPSGSFPPASETPQVSHPVFFFLSIAKTRPFPEGIKIKAKGKRQKAINKTESVSDFDFNFGFGFRFGIWDCPAPCGLQLISPVDGPSRVTGRFFSL